MADKKFVTNDDLKEHPINNYEVDMSKQELNLMKDTPVLIETADGKAKVKGIINKYERDNKALWFISYGKGKTMVFDKTAQGKDRASIGLDELNKRLEKAKTPLKVKKAEVDKSKYPDYPYEMISKLSKGENNNYDVYVGKIVDPRLAKTLNTNKVMYQKANKDFDIDLGHAKAHINKGQVSGAYIPMSDKNMQISQLKLASPKYMENPSWIDINSSIKGKWFVPSNTLVRDSNIEGSEIGIAMGDAVIDSSGISATNANILGSNVINSGIAQQSLSRNKHNEFELVNSTLYDTQDIVNDIQKMNSSYIENAVAKSFIDINNGEFINTTSNTYNTIQGLSSKEPFRKVTSLPISVKDNRFELDTYQMQQVKAQREKAKAKEDSKHKQVKENPSKPMPSAKSIETQSADKTKEPPIAKQPKKVKKAPEVNTQKESNEPLKPKEKPIKKSVPTKVAPASVDSMYDESGFNNLESMMPEEPEDNQFVDPRTNNDLANKSSKAKSSPDYEPDL